MAGMLEMICLGEGPSQEEERCRCCGRQERCLNQAAGFGLGTITAQMERFGQILDGTTGKFTEVELDILQEMIDCAGYTASTYLDYAALGRVPDQRQLEAEKRMEEKQREYLAELKRKYPHIWRVYCYLLTAIEPSIEI